MTEELFIDGQFVDLKPGASITLNFKSNLLGDISKITSSNSQTIQCPKTTRNRKIFDNPGAPAYVSDRRYKRFRAFLVRNGVKIVEIGYAVLLSSSETYEIALYWGVMANFQAWVDKGAKLNELEGTEAIAWNKNVAISTVEQLTTNGYGYAEYDCGVADTEQVNIHPCATAWWVLGKIAAQAGFEIDVPERYADTMRRIAIPCLRRNASPESWDYSALKGEIYSRLYSEPYMGSFIYYWGITTKSISQSILPFYIGETNIPTGGKRVEMSYFSTCSCKELRIKIQLDTFRDVASEGAKMHIRKRKENSWVLTKYKWAPSVNSVWTYDVDDVIDCSDFNEFCIGLDYTHNHKTDQGGTTFVGNIEIYPNDENLTYPSLFPIPQNLPEISQVDFIKAICAMLGIFIVPDPSNANRLRFSSVDALQANKAAALDWSHKLVRSNDDEPKATEFKIGDYCRNNFFRYKEDDAVTRKADGNLKIDSELLDTEKTVVTLPFAPSDGSTIRQYELREKDTGAADEESPLEAVNVSDRIMLLTEHDGRARLRFDGLEFESLLTQYYAGLSQLLNSAITITEQIRIDEIDIKTLDYTRPFYLRQYGKYYGIVSIQSSTGKSCEVKAIQLPADRHEEAPDPTKTDCRIGYKAAENIVLTATHPLHSDVSVRYVVHTADGQAEYTTLFPGGKTEYTTPYIVTRNFDRVEIIELTPSGDSMYNYLIAE